MWRAFQFQSNRGATVRRSLHIWSGSGRSPTSSSVCTGTVLNSERLPNESVAGLLRLELRWNLRISNQSGCLPFADRRATVDRPVADGITSPVARI